MFFAFGAGEACGEEDEEGAECFVEEYVEEEGGGVGV